MADARATTRISCALVCSRVHPSACTTQVLEEGCTELKALEALAERLRKALGVQAAVAATQAEHLHRLCKHARRRGANEAAAARAVHEELLMSYAHWCDHMGLLLLGGGALADSMLYLFIWGEAAVSALASLNSVIYL